MQTLSLACGKCIFLVAGFNLNCMCLCLCVIQRSLFSFVDCSSSSVLSISMAYAMLNVPGSAILMRGINPKGLENMRDEALEPADLNVIVVDVGGGTGFTALGIVKHVDAKNVTILDQSPHQLAKATQKEPLKACKFLEGGC
ncbi:hypothetical protein QQ045_008282 [Rhodiola kirilowii]